MYILSWLIPNVTRSHVIMYKLLKPKLTVKEHGQHKKMDYLYELMLFVSCMV